MGFFGGWSTVPGIKDLNEDISGLQFGGYVPGAGEKVVRKDARQLLKGKKGFYDTGLGAGIRSGVLADAANNKELMGRDIAARYAGSGMYNDSFKNALLTEQNRFSDRDTMNTLADMGMQGSQYLIGLNRADRDNMQNYNNTKSMYDLDKYKLMSGNLLQGTQRTGGFLGGLKGILDVAGSFAPGSALSKLGAGAINRFTAGGTR